MSWCLLQLVLSQIHHSICISVSSLACSIPNSPLSLYLGLHQLVLSQIHHSIHISVFTSLFYTNSPLNSYLGVFLGLSYPKFTTQFISRSSPACSTLIHH